MEAEGPGFRIDRQAEAPRLSVLRPERPELAPQLLFLRDVLEGDDALAVQAGQKSNPVQLGLNDIKAILRARL